MYKMYINGKCVEGAGDKLDVTCPATGELLETITTASIQQADEALEAAQAAFPAWSRLSLNERIGWMMKLKDACLAEKDEIVDLMAKEGGDAQIRMPSGEGLIVRSNCMASIGTVSNLDHENVNLGKAGRVRHMGFRPHNRGVVMNPNDHPHGGGEGKSPVGMPGPVTPWGKPTQGRKTRKHRNPSDKFIVKRRNGK